jgi:hypothetical protein
MIERELSKSVAQVLTLVPSRLTGHLSLQDVGVDMVLSVAFLRASHESASSFAADIADACSDGPTIRRSTPDGVPEDIADDYARAKAEVKAILRREAPAAEPVIELAPEIEIG